MLTLLGTVGVGCPYLMSIMGHLLGSHGQRWPEYQILVRTELGGASSQSCLPTVDFGWSPRPSNRCRWLCWAVPEASRSASYSRLGCAPALLCPWFVFKHCVTSRTSRSARRKDCMLLRICIAHTGYAASHLLC